eukprot:CAMPEP_0117603824 /NCGR_PEP_ID=MMETSP0784-20121206/78360_1 /TAXON_ID=39447 /ORGANISM="" /LENGTH=79 /DNA_ID=CAMNT_0005406815 /DNA_START=25 /DNA_END=261 /DNA_ORIENTATION=+
MSIGGLGGATRGMQLAGRVPDSVQVWPVGGGSQWRWMHSCLRGGHSAAGPARSQRRKLPARDFIRADTAGDLQQPRVPQ